MDPEDIPYKRKIVSNLLMDIGPLAVDPVGSHIIDSLWEATLVGMKHQRHSLAERLLASEQFLRDSPYGRAVWRNWKMDLYKSRRSEWSNLSPIYPGQEQGAKPRTAIQVFKSSISPNDPLRHPDNCCSHKI